ncbi:MAG TPA: hypothetical protein VHU80_21425 [Polyangiaceae bacterium]|jgi:hypothetical protein|nr:hypothetical protein [Polyangiaceae bacterium]
MRSRPQPGSKTAAPAPRVRFAVEALLAQALRSEDAGVRAAVEGEAAAVEAALFALVLRVALTCAHRPASEPALGFPDLGDALELCARRLRDAGVASPSLVGPPKSALDEPGSVERWLDPRTVDAVVGALAGDDGRIEHARVGSIYEELLCLRIRRLDGPGVALRPDGAWVTARSALAEPPALRSKWLQRTFGLPKSAVERLATALASATTEAEMLLAFAPLALRAKDEAAGLLVVDASVERRRSGSHYTPPSLARTVLSQTLSPLVARASSARILSLAVCDPSMGTGAFLEETAHFLSAALTDAWRREGKADAGDLSRAALSAVVANCLYGVDKDPLATDLARARLAELATGELEPPPDLSRRLKVGDALVGQVRADHEKATLFGSIALSGHPDAFDWQKEFPDVFGGPSPGFDACVGNPPWIAYVGRAAQPLAPALAHYYEETNPAFRSYRTLHGLFVRRAAELLASGGRLGLVLPTSVADLAGYAPTREAHDALCEVDPELFDFGDGAFDGVFQPCMALTSTRRASPIRAEPRIWPLGRSDLDAVSAGLLARLERLPRLPAALFGERGFQTTGDDLAHLRKLDAPSAPFVLPIREGSDVSEFRTGAPRTFLDPAGLRGRLRDAESFRAVDVLIRQTARFPIASLSDGTAFRNSILAGFSGARWTAPALAAYLNSTLVRFYHYMRHRDARQGMPQLKIGHLRALPDVADQQTRDVLDELGLELGRENRGIALAQRERLDDALARAFELSYEERASVNLWSLDNPLPKSRR